MRLKRTIGCLMVGGILFSNAALAFGNVSVTSAQAIRVVEEAVAYETILHNASETDSIGKGANMTETEALSLAAEYAKTYFQVDVEAEGLGFNNNISYREDWNQKGKYVWQISFSRHGRNQYLNVNVTINDEDGKLMELRKYGEDGNTENQIARYTQEEAEAIAHQFLLKTNQNILNQLILDPNYNNIYYYSDNSSGLYPREYSVYYTRQRNGIPVMQDGVHIGVNSGTGEVSSYSLNWREESLPQSRATITSEEAAKLFEDNLKLQLVYIPVRDRSTGREIVEEVKLAYTPDYQGGMWLDAVTGKMVNYIGASAEEEKTIDVSEREKAAFKNLNTTRKIHTKEISREEAVSLATKLLEKLYKDSTIKIESVNYNSNNYYGDGNRRKTWNVNFNLDNDFYGGGNLAIDALTEEVIQVNNYNWRMREMMASEEFQPTVKWEDAYHKAIEMLKLVYPEKLKQLDLQQTYRENIHYYNDRKLINPEYYFNFARKENDIIFSGNQINVSIDSTTGQLQNIYYRWDDMKLPEQKNLIEEEAAIDLLTQQLEARLAYSRVPIVGGPEEGEIKLVYMNRPKNDVQYNYIDAQTGDLLDWNGQQVKTKDGKVETIEENLKGHWAERELKIMHANGVIDLQKQNLQDAVIKNEIVEMMVKAMGYWYYSGEEPVELKFTDVNSNDEYYEHLQRAVMQRLIENEEVAFKGYETISKEEFAEMLVKITPLEKAAIAKDIYRIPVKDAEEIHPDKLGAVALMYGLDILKGEEDTYQPKKKVSLEEVAVGVYRTFKLFGRNRY